MIWAYVTGICFDPDFEIPESISVSRNEEGEIVAYGLPKWTGVLFKNGKWGMKGGGEKVAFSHWVRSSDHNMKPPDELGWMPLGALYDYQAPNVDVMMMNGDIERLPTHMAKLMNRVGDLQRWRYSVDNFPIESSTQD